MIRLWVNLIIAGLLMLGAGCSKREQSDKEADEWAAIQALADDAVVVPVVGGGGTNGVPGRGNSGAVPAGEFADYLQRLEKAKAAERIAGETLLTGQSLVFDHGDRVVRMDKNVVVEDDEGSLRTEHLVGRFSISNKVEFIEASGGVNLTSGERIALADDAVCNYGTGFVKLQGKASVTDGANRLSGEQIELWIRDDRRMVCEPNALLEIAEAPGLVLEEGAVEEPVDVEVRADRIEFDEARAMVTLKGNVRLRHPQAAINCETAHLFLKDNNKIDWLEALGEVIIQSEGRKALAERATYHADEGLFVLEGDPKVKQGQNVMTGDRIKFWHETRRMVCEPNARLLLYLDAETKAKFLKDLNE